jgi:hypothetical protein
MNHPQRTVGLTGIAILLALSLSPSWVAGKEKKSPMDIEGGILDEIHLKVATLSPDVPVVIRKFSTEGANLGTAEEKDAPPQRTEAISAMQKVAPDLLLNSLTAELKAQGVFKELITEEGAAVPENAIVVEGGFVLFDPGSRAKRYWGGFGAGKSGVGVEGKITSATGETLAEFKHRKHSGIGIGGGDYFKFLSDDTKDVGRDTARFLDAWATGKRLDKE